MWSKAHLAEVLRWSGDARVDLRTLAVAAIGMAGPVLAGLALGRTAAGLMIGLGAMLLAGGPRDEAAGGAAERTSPLSAILPAALAVASATLIAALPERDLAMLALAGIAALVSGFSRPAGVAAIRFLIYFILCLSLLEAAGDHRGTAAWLFGIGAVWNLAVRAMLPRPAAEPVLAAPARVPTSAQRRAYFRRTLGTFAGWQFAIRVTAGLAAALLIRDLWPAHHFTWVVLTVALLTQRPIEHFPVKISQRAIGTTAGVAVSWAILALGPSPPVIVAMLCLLAIAAPFARAGNYLAWSAVSSPAILLAMDFGRPIETALLTDRLIATLAGAGIVLAANFAADRWLSAQPTGKPAPQ
jgi:hypothetical protein